MKDQVKTSRFRTWLKNIPIEDPINRQMAALLQVVLLGLLVLVVIATFINFSLTTDPYEILIQSLQLVIIAAIPMILLRRGYFHISIYYLIAPFLILVTAQLFVSNLRNEAETLAFFTLAILLAGLLLGRRALIFIYLASAAIVLFFALKEQDATLRLDYIAVAGNFILLNGLMSVFIDYFGVTLRNNLRSSLHREEEIKVLNDQLQKQVAELERFTYTVSHDLRSPLVTIKGFLGILEKDIDDDRPDKVKSDIQRIAGATDKMAELLSDLLDLSRVGRLINSPEEIDTVRLIKDAIESVDAHIRSRGASVNITSDLPNIFGDRTRLREVFENLIDNAIKYTGKQTDPVIEIGVRNQANQPVFYVKDNGMGIEQQYHQKIFGLFEKLNPNIEGTGIGLALIKRIIETHGGKLWVESEGLNKGSMFCFTLPEQPL